MSIKSDKWIRKMALEHNMIVPFESQQVKARPNRDDFINKTEPSIKVISYGLSSYGYDVRCSDEFKVFTNINSTLVDPKNFDPKCFVDVKGEYCIIPPNSFALARTVERFKIPRDVLVKWIESSTR